MWADIKNARKFEILLLWKPLQRLMENNRYIYFVDGAATEHSLITFFKNERKEIMEFSFPVLH